jgi:hypothetical protein
MSIQLPVESEIKQKVIVKAVSQKPIKLEIRSYGEQPHPFEGIEYQYKVPEIEGLSPREINVVGNHITHKLDSWNEYGMYVTVIQWEAGFIPTDLPSIEVSYHVPMKIRVKRFPITKKS